MPALRKKSERLTGYLSFLLTDLQQEFPESGLKVLTPPLAHERGCQQSIVVPEVGRQVFEFLSQNGVVADWREPDVIRVAPVPLYNSFADVYQFAQLLGTALRLMEKI
jgi:kynureninase